MNTFWWRFRLIVIDESEFRGQPSELHPDLLLHEVEAHGLHGHPEQQVEAADDALLFVRPRVHVCAGHVVPEPNRGQGDHTEVGGHKEVPFLLPYGKHDGTSHYITRHYCKS